jgi:hypothetical protein
MAYQRERPPPSASITVAEGTFVVGEHGGYRVIKAGSAPFEHVSTRALGSQPTLHKSISICD